VLNLSALSFCSLIGPPRRKILTLEEGFTTQVVTLWCFNTVGRKILTLGEGFTTQVVTAYSVVTSSYPMVFQAFNTVLGGREFFSVAFVMAPFRTDPL
jgi:hypothetical protein